MAGYLYRCAECGTFGKDFPIGTAAIQAPCPACGTASGRQYTSPMLGASSSPAFNRARERSERSGDAPDVVQRKPSLSESNSQPRPVRARPGFPALPQP
jgi:predicted  nucleic acid-binding Zn-ribbon protein